MTCAQCGATNTPGDKFCSRCGALLTSEYIYGPPPSLSGEPGAARGPANPYDVPSSSQPTQPYIVPSGSPNPYAGAPPASDSYSPSSYVPPALPGSPGGPLTPVGGRNWTPWAVLGVLAALLLLVGAGTAIFFVSRSLPAGRVRPSPTVAAARTGPRVATPTAGASFVPKTDQERAVIAAIEANNNAQIAALRQVDAALLEGKMSGAALTENQQEVERLKSQDEYEEARLLGIQYSAPKFLSATEASIRTVETWESILYDQDGSEVGRSGPDTLYEIYYLTRTASGWVVNQVDISRTPPSSPDQ
jgi:hypothetical protein